REQVHGRPGAAGRARARLFGARAGAGGAGAGGAGEAGRRGREARVRRLARGRRVRRRHVSVAGGAEHHGGGAGAGEPRRDFRRAVVGVGRVQADVGVSRLGERVGRPARPEHQMLCTMAMMLPSVSLNQAVLAPPPVAMPFFVLRFGMSYSSNVTPFFLSSATSRSTSSTCQNAWLARDVPAKLDGYMKQAV